MSSALLSLVLDFAVLLALVGTIYYAMRLSQNLGSFRTHRTEMKELIAELSKNINGAQSAIEGLKATSNIAADNLDDVLHDSRRMAEELRLINETSDSLANRLEKLASENRKAAQGAAGINMLDDQFEDEEYFGEPEPANTDSAPALDAPEPPSFFIQDREYDEGDEQGKNDDDAFVSEAEKELLQVLQQNKKRGGKRA